MILNVANPTLGLIGRFENSAFGWGVYWNGANVHILLKDAAGVNVQADLIWAPSMASTPVVPYLVTCQIDKTANLFRGRVSRNGASVATVSTSIATLGTFTKAGQKFGFGCVPSGGPVLNQGGWVSYAFYATGSQTEGANVLRDTAVGLGWEI